ncbi:hypothetical protein, partial [Rhizobium favelukesii]|uniref:hypothetical protein n=1 Tax=Rhizobium favelukesii TaxID=348824 RepID=UPI00215E5A8F
PSAAATIRAHPEPPRRQRQAEQQQTKSPAIAGSLPHVESHHQQAPEPLADGPFYWCYLPKTSSLSRLPPDSDFATMQKSDVKLPL